VSVIADLKEAPIQFAFVENPPQGFLRNAAVNVIKPISNFGCDLSVVGTFTNKDNVLCIAGIICRKSTSCPSKLCGFKD